MMTISLCSHTPKEIAEKFAQAEIEIKKENFRDAVKIYTEIHDLGYIVPYAEVGYLIEKRIGNIDEAIIWYKEGIDESDEMNCYTALGRLAISGKSGAGNIREGIQYLEKARENGSEYALICLAFFFERNISGFGDLDKAEEYAKKGIELGYIFPLVIMSKICYRKGKLFSALKYRLLAMKRSYPIIKKDPYDSRLYMYISSVKAAHLAQKFKSLKKRRT